MSSSIGVVLYYASHPDVEIDRSLPVDQWTLSAKGRSRAQALLRQPWCKGLTRIISSPEKKAKQTASIVADQLGLAIEVLADSGENDRAATGFLPPDEFEKAADQFFHNAEQSYRGWERAIDAQSRIVGSLEPLLNRASEDNTLVIGHGAVGTLWYCHLAGLAIDRGHDQPFQGHFFAVRRSTRRPSHGWRSY